MTSKKAMVANLTNLEAQVMKAFDKITEYEAKYGTTQGTREQNKELFWYGGENPDDYSHDGSDFMVKDITRSELLFARLLDTWRRFNRTAMGEEWKGNDITKALKDRIEGNLFESQVAVFRHPISGDLVAEMFTWEEQDLNVVTNLPNKIKIVSTNKSINGIELPVEEVAIGFNTSSRTSELAFDMPNMEMIINSYMALALTIRRGKPKTLIAGMDDDTLAYDIKRAIESDEWIEFLNISAKQLQQLDIRFDNSFKEKMEMVLGTVGDFIKFKGWNTNGLIMKRERQSESELDNNNEFKHFLVWNKIVERQELAKQIQEKLGANITYDGEELLAILKGEVECQEDSQDKSSQEQE